jgi:large subunit ribosomal protein L6
MSRVGKNPIPIPEKVKVEFKGSEISVQGPKGTLSLSLHPLIKVTVEEANIIVARQSEDKRAKALHGTMRALINNMVVGVTEGFKKELEIVGMGYKTQMKGKDLVLQMGFSHPVEITPPEGLKVSTSGPTKIIIEGIDKHQVGQFAAQLRDIYPPEPYKGKGIRYAGEEVRKKLGKAMTK